MGLFDNLFKAKPDAADEAVVEAARRISEHEKARLLEASKVPTAAPTPRSAPVPAHKTTPPVPAARAYSPRSLGQVVTPSRANNMPGRPGDTSVPATRRIRFSSMEAAGRPAEVVLLIEDVLPRIPTELLSDATQDLKRELHFKVDDLSADIARGRAAVSLGRIAAQVPELFREPIAADDPRQIRLPLQKLVEQIGFLPTKPAPPKPVAPAMELPPPPGPGPSVPFPPLPTPPSLPPLASPPVSEFAAPPPPAPAQPETVAPQPISKEAAAAIASVRISLNLAAVLRTCPRELIVAELPAIPEHDRISFPWAPIEKQLPRGTVEVSSVRFIFALPAYLQGFFEAREGVRVPLPIDEIQRNLPAADDMEAPPSPVPEPEPFASAPEPVPAAMEEKVGAPSPSATVSEEDDAGFPVALFQRRLAAKAASPVPPPLPANEPSAPAASIQAVELPPGEGSIWEPPTLPAVTSPVEEKAPGPSAVSDVSEEPAALEDSAAIEAPTIPEALHVAEPVAIESELDEPVVAEQPPVAETEATAPAPAPEESFTATEPVAVIEPPVSVEPAEAEIPAPAEAPEPVAAPAAEAVPLAQLEEPVEPAPTPAASVEAVPPPLELPPPVVVHAPPALSFEPAPVTPAEAPEPAAESVAAAPEAFVAAAPEAPAVESEAGAAAEETEPEPVVEPEAAVEEPAEPIHEPSPAEVEAVVPPHPVFVPPPLRQSGDTVAPVAPAAHETQPAPPNPWMQPPPEIGQRPAAHWPPDVAPPPSPILPVRLVAPMVARPVVAPPPLFSGVVDEAVAHAVPAAPPPEPVAPPPPPPPPRPLDLQLARAAFGLEEGTTLSDVGAELIKLPGLGACYLAVRHETGQAGELPASFHPDGVRALAAQLTGSLASSAGHLGSGRVQHLTIFADDACVSFFTQGEATVVAIHRTRAFLPGVRERLTAAATALAEA